MDSPLPAVAPVDTAQTERTAPATGISATPVAASTLVADGMPPLPTPGAQIGDRVVRASGTLPYSGLGYRQFRHTGRMEVAAQAAAEGHARAERGDKAQASDGETTYALLALCTDVWRDGAWAHLTFDAMLDLDSDDSTALVRNLMAPRPPSPSTPS